MALINILKPGLGELFGLSVLSLMGIVMAFMVMSMAGGLESRAMSDLGIEPAASKTLDEVENRPTGALALLVRN